MKALSPAPAPPASRHWSTRSLAASDLTDAWQSTLADNYGHWQVTQAVPAGFRASVRHREVGSLRVVECVCDPCSGRRLAPQIRIDAAPFIGVQITRAGRERFRFGGESTEIGAGDLVVWTSEQPTAFEVTERLHKVSLVLPWAELQPRLPRGVGFGGTVIDSRSGIGAVLHSHVDSLARQLDRLGEHDQAAVRRATLELLAAAISHRVDTPPRGLAARYLRQLQDHILAHLPDESLDVASIAAANQMSPRYVHLLFAQTGTSVSDRIRSQRLARCREDLRSPAFRDRGVAEIAYAWGFRDAAHFSRVFRRQYGLAPREWREGRPGPVFFDAAQADRGPALPRKTDTP